MTLFDPDPEVNPRRDPDEKRLPRDLVAARIRAENARLARLADRMLAEPYNPPRICEIRGCTEVAVEQHHWAEREWFGDFAERCPMSWVCRKHHDLITERRRTSTSAQVVRQ